MFGKWPLAREIRGGRDVHQHRLLRPDQLLQGLGHRHPRRGEREPLVFAEVRVVRDDSGDVGLRRCPTHREAQVAPGGLWPDVDREHQAERLHTAVGFGCAPLQPQRLAVHEVAVLFVGPDGTGGGDDDQWPVRTAGRHLVPRRLGGGSAGVLAVAAHHRRARGVEAEGQRGLRAVDAGRALSAGGAGRVGDGRVRLVRRRVGVDHARLGHHRVGLQVVADSLRREADRVVATERAVGAEFLAPNRLQHTLIGIRLGQHIVGHRAAGR